MTYTGPSVIDYLKSISKDSSFETRAALAKQYGIKNYTGDTAQNTLLLEKLKTQEPEKVLKTGFITNNVVKAVKNLVTTGKTGLTTNDLYDYKLPKAETPTVPFLDKSTAYKAPASSLLSLDSALKTGGKVDTTSQYIQDPNNKNASIKNPYYKEKSVDQIAADLLKEDTAVVTEKAKDAGTIYQKENGDLGTKEVVEESKLEIEDKPAQRARTLTLPAEQMAFDKWAQTNNIQDPFRDQSTDWERLYKENKTLADAGTLSLTQELINKYKLGGASSTSTSGGIGGTSSTNDNAGTSTTTSVKYVDGFPKSSDDMEQWIAQGRVWDPVVGKWKEKSSPATITAEETNSLLASALAEIKKRLAAGATLTTEQQAIYDRADAALNTYNSEKKEPEATKNTEASKTESSSTAKEVTELENLNQLADIDSSLSGYTIPELRDVGLNIIGSYGTYKAYADDTASKLKANPNVELDPVQRAVYNYYY